MTVYDKRHIGKYTQSSADAFLNEILQIYLTEIKALKTSTEGLLNSNIFCAF